MKTFFGFAALAMAFLVAHSDAYAYQQLAEFLPTSPGHCLWKDAGSSNSSEWSLHPVGSSWNVRGCERVNCFRRRGKLYLQVSGCGSTGADPPCKVLPMDNTKPYPRCCPRPWCP